MNHLLVRPRDFPTARGGISSALNLAILWLVSRQIRSKREGGGTKKEPHPCTNRKDAAPSVPKLCRELTSCAVRNAALPRVDHPSCGVLHWGRRSIRPHASLHQEHIDRLRVAVEQGS